MPRGWTLCGRTGEYNFAVSCFTRTIVRELEKVDFSWGTFKAGLCLVQPRRSAGQNIIEAFLSHENISLFASLFLAIFTFANLILLAERGDNPDFRGDGSYSDGIWHGMWFIVVTFTTVGYGEKTPITNTGKVVVMTWMFVGLGFYCLFTGTLAAYLTNSAARPSQYDWNSARDNNNLRVGTVGGSSLVAMLEEKGINVRRFFDSEQASYPALMRGEIDIMVADWPIIYGDMRRGILSNVDFVCHEKTNDDTYGFAFPNNANMNQNLTWAMTKLNAGLIEWDQSPKKSLMFEKYFSGDPELSDELSSDGDSPRWTPTTIVAFTLALALVTGWTLVAAKRMYLQYVEDRRRKEAGEPDDGDDEQILGGIAKAKDLFNLMRNLESLEDRLVEAQVIKPKKRALDRWQTIRKVDPKVASNPRTASSKLLSRVLGTSPMPESPGPVAVTVAPGT